MAWVVMGSIVSVVAACVLEIIYREGFSNMDKGEVFLTRFIMYFLSVMAGVAWPLSIAVAFTWAMSTLTVMAWDRYVKGEQ